MAQKLTFKSWERSKIFDIDPAHPLQKVNGRLNGTLPITIHDNDTGDEDSDNAPFTLRAPIDIEGLHLDRAIKHMAPAPGVNNAETTKLVHIDLRDTGLPWRYTPEANRPDLLQRPWLILLVGTTNEIKIDGRIANVQDTVLVEHNLTNSHLWAHTQTDGTDNTKISRILSPGGLKDSNGKTGLLPQRDYIAVLVKGFNDLGEDMWTVNGNNVERKFGKKGVLQALHSWGFTTGEKGDFETLAEALHLPPAGDVGKSKLFYRRNIPADNVNIDEDLEIRGAITSIQEVPNQLAAIEKVRADLDILNNELPDTIGLPQYGRPWISDPDEVPVGWPADINDDPRFRGISGLGLWMGVEAQEALMDAAVKQAGALREAGQRIGNLALGLLASGSLWDQRLPTDKNERLRILGPMMGRMLASGGGLVLDNVTSKTSPLSKALFSSSAQRILRDRSVQTRHISDANGGINRSEAFNEANQGEQQVEVKGLPHFDSIVKEMGLKTLDELFGINNELIAKILNELIDFIKKFINSYRRKRDDLIGAGQIQDIPNFQKERADALFNKLSDLLQTRLSENQMRCEGRQIIERIGQSFPEGILLFFARVLEEDPYQFRLYDGIGTAMINCMAITPCGNRMENFPVDVPNRETFCNELIDSLATEPISESTPINLGLLSDRLVSALDPRQADPPAKLRLCSRLTGIDCTRLIRPEFPIGLDFPTWDLLKKYDKEWLLPGVNDLEKNSVLSLQTNPPFIEAFMVGINTQFMSEMRWRDLAVDRTCTPLRMFWGQVNYVTQKRQADIEPLGEWAKEPAEPIGSLKHQTIQPDDPNTADGNRLVIVFRSDLFRRYPSTLVYLIKPAGGEDVDALLKMTPVLEHNVNDRPARKFFGPTFVGTITPEITFFSFDVKPNDLSDYWLVLDEPPTELRFRNDKPFNNNFSSAAFAKSELDKPTRVAISGASLKQSGNQ